MTKNITCEDQKEFPLVWVVKPGFFGLGGTERHLTLRSDVDDHYNYDEDLNIVKLDEEVDIVELDEEEKNCAILYREVSGNGLWDAESWMSLVDEIEERLIAMVYVDLADGVQFLVSGRLLSLIRPSGQYSDKELISLKRNFGREEVDEEERFGIDDLSSIIEFFKESHGVTIYSLDESCENGINVYCMVLDDPSDIKSITDRWERASFVAEVRPSVDEIESMIADLLDE